MNLFNLDWHLSGLATDQERDFDSKVNLRVHCHMVDVIYAMKTEPIRNLAFDLLYE